MPNASPRLAVLPAVTVLGPMLLVLVPMLLVGCGKTIGETLDDPTITLRVKTALMNDSTLGALQIQVDTTARVVTLSGDVRSTDEAERAIQLARRVPGVKDVKSALKISRAKSSGARPALRAIWPERPYASARVGRPTAPGTVTPHSHRSTLACLASSAGEEPASETVVMAQKTVQLVIGQILTDEELRTNFLERPAETLAARRDVGFEPPPLLHAAMGDLYRTKVEQMAAALQGEETRLGSLRNRARPD